MSGVNPSDFDPSKGITPSESTSRKVKQSLSPASGIQDTDEYIVRSQDEVPSEAAIARVGNEQSTVQRFEGVIARFFPGLSERARQLLAKETNERFPGNVDQNA